jgi:hypothetical protein
MPEEEGAQVTCQASIELEVARLRRTVADLQIARPLSVYLNWLPFASLGKTDVTSPRNPGERSGHYAAKRKTSGDYEHAPGCSGLGHASCHRLTYTPRPLESARHASRGFFEFVANLGLRLAALKAAARRHQQACLVGRLHDPDAIYGR